MEASYSRSQSLTSCQLSQKNTTVTATYAISAIALPPVEPPIRPQRTRPPAQESLKVSRWAGPSALGRDLSYNPPHASPHSRRGRRTRRHRHRRVGGGRQQPARPVRAERQREVVAGAERLSA